MFDIAEVEDDEPLQDWEDIRKNLMSELDATAKVEQEHVKVYLRVRPLKKEELEKNENQVSNLPH